MVLVIPHTHNTWKSTLKDAKVLGVLKRQQSATSPQIQVKNFEETLEKVASKYGKLGTKQLMEPHHHALQLELSSQAEQRSEAYLSQMGHRLTKVPAGFKDAILVLGTDGVGTKIKIAQQTQRNSTVGIDLVAMCVNDIMCNGAEPLTFSSYYACGKLTKVTAQSISDGVAEGARQAGASLIGKWLFIGLLKVLKQKFGLKSRWCPHDIPLKICSVSKWGILKIFLRRQAVVGLYHVKF